MHWQTHVLQIQVFTVCPTAWLVSIMQPEVFDLISGRMTRGCVGPDVWPMRKNDPTPTTEV